MDQQDLIAFRKNIDFMEIMFRMSCASTRLAFGAGLEQLSVLNHGNNDADVEEGCRRLRAVITSQLAEFEKLLELVGE